MASAALNRHALSIEGARELASGISPRLALPALLFRLADGDEGQPRWGAAFLVKIRENGFMIGVPQSDELQDTLSQFCAAAEEAEDAVFHTGEVQLSTGRSRNAGRGDITLVDLPWGVIPNFMRMSALRGALQQNSAFIALEVGGVRARPETISTLQLADGWVAEAMDEPTAAEYATAAEEEWLDGEAIQGMSPTPSIAPAAEVPNGQPDARVQELEAEVAALKAQIEGSKKVQFGKTPGLFQPARQASVDALEMEKLMKLAGTPPPRTGAHEQRRQVHPKTTLQETMHAEIEKEAMEPDVQDLTLDNLPMQCDAMTQMLVAQMRQNSLLLQRLVNSKPSDPIMASLSGSDSASAGSSSGVKGCMAREAFVRSTSDLVNIASVVRKNALQELGMDASREDSGVMRRYIERRIPLAEHRLLLHMATLAAEGWALAFETRNDQMLGFLGLQLMFIEQVALDQGKLPLAWLLTGLPEPNFQVHFAHRKVPGLKPFSRLASPVWVSANLAYLRDLDFLEGRMSQIGKPAAKKSLTGGEEETDKPPKIKPTPKKKNRKGQGKGAESEETAE